MERVYTPESLGDRWDVSAQHVRDMCARQEIASFRLGRLYRIPAAEVGRIEACQANQDSSGIEGNGPSITETPRASPEGNRPAPKIVRMPKSITPNFRKGPQPHGKL